MERNWPIIHKYVLAYEGGYVDHPDDPGGATNKGVTQRVYNGFRRSIGQPTRSVAFITDEEVDTIYRQQYWNTVKGGSLPSGLDLTVYDYAVNSGPKRSVKALQRALGVSVDGWLGNETMGAVDMLDTDGVRRVIKEINTARWEWLKRLKHWRTFGKGWTRRVMGAHIGYQHGDYGVIDRSIGLVNDKPLPAPKVDKHTPLGVAARTDGNEEDRNITTTIRDVISDGRAISTAVGVGGLTTVQNIAETDGPLAWGISIAVVLLAVAGVALVIRELRRD